MDLFCKKRTFSDTPQRHGAVKRHASGEELARRRDEGGQKVKGEPKPGLPSFRAKKPDMTTELPGGICAALVSVAADRDWSETRLCQSQASLSHQRDSAEGLSPDQDSGLTPPDAWDKTFLSMELELLEERIRKEFKYINAQPLYQDYWLTYMESQSSVCWLGASLSGLLSPSQTRKDSSFSCWQDLPEVQSRGLLTQLSLQQRRLQEAMFEVITSEASYLKSLTVVVSNFLGSRELAMTLHSMERHTLFSNLLEVRDVSESFLLDLEQRLEESLLMTDLSDLVLKHSEAFKRVYIPYVTNQMYQEALAQRLLRENIKFVTVVRRLEELPVCQRQPLKSFLVLPFQRITRLKIVLENILKLSDPESLVIPSLKQAIRAVGEIVSECNDNVRRMKQTEELVLLEQQTVFRKVKSIPLITRGRCLVRQGELLQVIVEEASGGSRIKIAMKPVQLHLFNDLLLISGKKEEGRFSVLDYAQTSNVKAERLTAKSLGLPSETFLLHLTENHAGSASALILQAHSKSRAVIQNTAILESNRIVTAENPSFSTHCPLSLSPHPILDRYLELGIHLHGLFIQ
ncbi:rho guanine nucleotide exchange factor 19-like isoform X2 [Acipenser ruthenus]|uniref:rho guanine nucleotide exchange factor 19-like isoform X2 n=1 Tax=Acipenser ruthenus TaxID=7906 RepID=UPI002741A028|nr:rho guanine nucleotide exchange factor 19-like isoform X2 [Acipenser ruthenus]